MDVAECKCNSECNYSGPRLCGSNLKFYRNKCKLDLANCELDSNITTQSINNCSAVDNTTKVKGQSHYQITKTDSNIVEPPLIELENKSNFDSNQEKSSR